MIKFSTVIFFSIGFLIGTFLSYFLGLVNYRDTFLTVSLISQLLATLSIVIALRAWFGYKEVF